MRRKHPETVECPLQLTRFVVEEWPASDAEVELMGEAQHSAFYAWIRWLHARAEFADRYDVDADAIPDRTTPAMRRLAHSLGGRNA